MFGCLAVWLFGSHTHAHTQTAMTHMVDDEHQLQQQLHIKQQQQEEARKFNKVLREMSKNMQHAATLKSYGAIEGKNFIEPINTTDEGVQQAKARKRKAIDEVHMQANKIIDNLVKLDKMITKTQEVSYEHSILSNKLRHQNKIESKIIDERKKRQISIQELRTTNSQRPPIVLSEEEEDYFGDGCDLR